jgi:glutamine synthetase
MPTALEPAELVFVGMCDLSGHVRGKAMPLDDLASRAGRGVGIVPSAIMMSAFGPIHDTPYGTRGDLALVPDLSTLVDVAFADGEGERFCLGDVLAPDGAPWACCPRGVLHRAIAALRDEAGLQVQAAFEQEFTYAGVPDRPASYRLRGVREAGPLGGLLVAALRQAGVAPEGFMAEYGPRQFEVTVRPRPALRAADEAVITRELIRAVAARCLRPGASGGHDPQAGEQPGIPSGVARGAAASLAPMPTPDGIGNGTHIHLSLLDADGRPALCDASGTRLSRRGERFAAGILHHLPALCALAAPSVASYYRLRPGRWAPTRADLATHDRGAALRVCPVFAGAAEPAPSQFNVEFRVADATASPYMALGALIWAGLDGLRRDLRAPEAAALPDSLAAALAALERDAEARDWMGGELMTAYLMLKASEQAALAGLDDAEICGRYADAY